MRRRDPDLLQILKFTYDECEICPSSRNLHLHHVIFKSHGGDDVRGNIISLCQDCHEAYHQGKTEAKLAVAALVRDRRRDVHEYLLQTLGESTTEVWFSRHGV